MYDPESALVGTTAVFEAMPENPAVKALADLATDAKFDRKELTITVAKSRPPATTSSRTSPPSTGIRRSRVSSSPTTSSRTV